MPTRNGVRRVIRSACRGGVRAEGRPRRGRPRGDPSVRPSRWASKPRRSNEAGCANHLPSAVERPRVLVGPDLLEGRALADASPDRDERRHAAHGVGATAVARLHEQLRVGAKKWLLHRHLAPVGQDKRRLAAAGLDRAEDVVPSAAVQAGRVLLQLEQDLVHLESGQRLDQERALSTRREGKGVIAWPNTSCHHRASRGSGASARRSRARPAG